VITPGAERSSPRAVTWRSIGRVCSSCFLSGVGDADGGGDVQHTIRSASMFVAFLGAIGRSTDLVGDSFLRGAAGEADEETDQMKRHQKTHGVVISTSLD